MSRNLVWLPNFEGHFVQWSTTTGRGSDGQGTEIRLYETSQQASASVASSARPSLRGVNRDLESQNVSSIAWSPSASRPLDFAAGLSTGQIVIANIELVAGARPHPDSQGLQPSGAGTVLYRPPTTSKSSSSQSSSSRPCNSVGWNSLQNNLLVAGFGSNRGSKSEGAVQVWDVEAKSLAQVLGSEGSKGQAKVDQAGFRGEFFNDEACNSVSWVPGGSGQMIAAGFAKFIRFIDARLGQPVSSVRSGAQHLAVDPFVHGRIATYGGGERDESTIKIWDQRSLQEPLMQVHIGSSAPRRIQFSPTREGILSAQLYARENLEGESSMHLWMLRSNEAQRAVGGSGAARAAGGIVAASDHIFHHKMTGFGGGAEEIADFAWHPTDEERLLTVSAKDNYWDMAYRIRAPLSFGEGGPLAAFGSKMFDCSGGEGEGGASKAPQVMEEDISHLMRCRAEAGYLLNAAANAVIVSKIGGGGSQELESTWRHVAMLLQAKNAEGGGGGEDDEVAMGREPIKGLNSLIRAQAEASVSIHKPMMMTGKGQGGGPGEARRSTMREGSVTESEATQQSRLVQNSRSISGDDVPDSSTSAEATEHGGGVDSPRMAGGGRSRGVAGEVGDEHEVFISEERREALRLCGYDFGDGSRDGGDFAGSEALEKKVRRTVLSGCHDEAAFMRLLQVDLSSALESLNKGATTHGPELGGTYAMAALALAGLDSSPSRVWKRAYDQMMMQCNRPYLKACFHILLREHASLLTLEGITLADKLSYACRFLSDDELHRALEELLESKEAGGELDALLITGLGPSSLGVLTNYVARTGDIQTASLLVGFFAQDIAESSMTSSLPSATNQMVHWTVWLDEYRSLLDRWLMWHERALLDVAMGPAAPSVPLARQHVICTSCNQPVSRVKDAGTPALGGTMGGSREANLPNITQCRSCKAELPRCCLCTLPTGCSDQPWSTGAPSKVPTLAPVQHMPAKVDAGSTPLYRGSNFGSWFTWCVKCNHGGHAGHIREWFAEKRVCPVTGCDCECMASERISQPYQSCHV